MPGQREGSHTSGFPFYSPFTEARSVSPPTGDDAPPSQESASRSQSRRSRYIQFASAAPGVSHVSVCVVCFITLFGFWGGSVSARVRVSIQEYLFGPCPSPYGFCSGSGLTCNSSIAVSDSEKNVGIWSANKNIYSQPPTDPVDPFPRAVDS